MKERKFSLPITDGVREFSQRILEDSEDILAINWKTLQENLLPMLMEFRSEMGEGKDPFANEELPPEQELGLNLFLNVVNFCFQDPETGMEYRYTGKNGNIILRSTGLKSAMAESGINWGSFSEVSGMTHGHWKRITQTGPENPLFLGAERGRRIARFAEYLLIRGFPTPESLIENCGYDTEKLLGILDESGFFDDLFMKRSQLTVHIFDNVLKRRFDRGLSGTDKLTVMADYRLPQILYNSGVIELSPSLSKKLETGVKINPDSREENALRAATVVVGERLAHLMGIQETEVDMLLWVLARKLDKEGRMRIPHMLVSTDKY